MDRGPARVFLAATAVAVTIAGAARAERAEPFFRSTVERIGESMRAQMTSWHRGCPVGIDSLRLVTVSRWGFDGRVHDGQLVVGRRQAAAVVRALGSLFAARFPIRRMRPIDAYGGDDHRSMAADNTSAFNCRFVSGTRRWSMHAYGRAVDVNPVQNPWVSGSEVSPRAGRQ